MDSLNPPASERFERNVIFRLARLLPLGLGGLSALALALLILAFAYAIIPSLKPSEPKPIPLPEPVRITQSELLEYMSPKKAKPQEDTRPETAAEPASEASEPAPAALDPDAVKLAAELGKLRKLLESRGIPFLDVKENRCVYTSYYGDCMETREVTVREGVGDHILTALNLYDDDSEAAIQEVPIPESGLTVKLRINNLPQKITVMAELNGILAAAAPNLTRKYLDAWMELRKEKEGAQRQAHAEKVSEQDRAYAEALNKHEHSVESKKALRMSSLMGIAISLGILVFSGLVLAVIAIERHSRAMNGLLLKLESQKAREPSGNLSSGEPG